jgi:diguanylate cyclase (GGDEF)-like protein
MDEEINKAIAVHARNHTPYGLAILDVDHFKVVNDTYGHSVGDEILIDLVNLIEGNIRCIDQLFRYGGEEFVLLLPDVDRKNLEAMMQRMRTTLHKSLKSPAGTVTVSFGLADLRTDDDVTQWFSRADQALYQAKATGRDRIVMADDPDSLLPLY